MERHRRGGEWSGTGKVRYVRSRGADKVSNSGIGEMRVRVRVMERMRGGFGENERVREWV